MTDRTIDDARSDDRLLDDDLFEELERVAKGLSVVTDRAGTDEIRRLVHALQDGERAPAPSPACDR